MILMRLFPLLQRILINKKEMIWMIEIFQNIFALSMQIGILIGIVLLLGHFMKRPYMAVGRYFLWLVLALRLLIPINLEWVNIEELKQGVQNFWTSGKEEQIIKEVSDKDYINNKKNTVKGTEIKEKSVNAQHAEKISGKKQISESEMGSKDVLGGLKRETFLKLGLSEIIFNIKGWYWIHENMIWTSMCMVWLFGVVGITGYEVIIYQSVYKSIRRWRRPAPKEYQKQFELVCQEMHISKTIPVFQCSKVTGPMVVGLCRPSIILPEREYQTESLYYIYRHELTHFCHRDLYYKLMQTMVKCIYWFHPLIHVMYQQSAFDMELVCDEKVIRNQSETFCQEYSFVLLDTLTVQNQRTFPLSTCFFNGGREQMKERFKRIMGQNKKKYGLGLFGLLIICAVILGNISLHPKKNAEASNSNAAQKGVSVSKENETKLTDKELTEIKNILIVGQENISKSDTKRADMNLLITVNPKQKRCYVTEIARDLAITCEGEYTKVCNAYAKYGMDSFKKALEKETGITIDSMIEVNFQQFEDVIDSVSGLNITLTKEEADYLNRTNYIREEKYRNVTEGTQLLNGQQVLGYARIRKVKSSNGKNDALGRGERALNIVTAMYERMKEISSKNLVNTISKVYDMVDISQLDMDTVYQIMQAVLTDGYTYETQQIPEAGAYVAKYGDGIGTYLEYDFSSSTALHKIISERVMKIVSLEGEKTQYYYLKDKEIEGIEEINTEVLVEEENGEFNKSSISVSGEEILVEDEDGKTRKYAAKFNEEEINLKYLTEEK